MFPISEFPLNIYLFTISQSDSVLNTCDFWVNKTIMITTLGLRSISIYSSNTINLKIWQVFPVWICFAIFLCTSYNTSYAQTTTISVRVNSGNDDVEERTNNGSMYMNSSDLELTQDGSRQQLVGMRFLSVSIPQGAVITDAYIEFETDETNSGTTNLTFRAEDIDDAPAFTSSAYNVSNRTRTTAAVNWNNVPPWTTISEKHQTPDLSSIIQEVVDRPGWAIGNDMVIIVNGSGERTAESYNGESQNAPLLVVTIEGEFERCYAVRQQNNGQLFSWSPIGGQSYIGTLGVPEVETMTMNGPCDVMYTANNADFGTIDLTTGNYTFLNALGTVSNPTLGNHTLNDVDGMAIDDLSGYIYASERIASGTDLLFLIDPVTGLVVYDAFGPGVDYVQIPGALQDIDDLAFSPCTHELYGVSTVSTSTSIYDIIVTIDIQTGVATQIVTLTECDSEGMSFNNDCDLFVSVGNSGCINEGAIFQVDLNTGGLTEITDIGGDVEAVVCCVDAPLPSPLDCSITQTSPVCNPGGADAEVLGSGGTGGYLYAWSTGDNTSAVSGLSAGIHTVTVTDFSGSTSTCQIDIITSDPSCTVIQDNPVICFGDSTAQATVIPIGGYGAYTYLWSNGETTVTADSLYVGIHTVTVTDSQSCSTTCNVTITGPPAALMCTAVEDSPVLCDLGANGVGTVTATDGHGGYTYLWDNGETTATATALTLGIHVVTVTDAEGCTTTCSMESTESPDCCATIYTNKFIRYNADTDP